MATEKFAKLFEDEKYGQILVMRDTNDDDKPCVKVMALPPGLGICAVCLAFESEDSAQRTFDRMGLEQARAGVADLWKFSSEVPHDDLLPRARPTARPQLPPAIRQRATCRRLRKDSCAKGRCGPGQGDQRHDEACLCRRRVHPLRPEGDAMIALALWLTASALAGLLIGCAIRTGGTDQPSPCSQNCNQGRNCTCQTPSVETQP